MHWECTFGFWCMLCQQDICFGVTFRFRNFHLGITSWWRTGCMIISILCIRCTSYWAATLSDSPLLSQLLNVCLLILSGWWKDNNKHKVRDLVQVLCAFILGFVKKTTNVLWPISGSATVSVVWNYNHFYKYYQTQYRVNYFSW